MTNPIITLSADQRIGALAYEWQDILNDDRLWPWVLPVVCNRGLELSKNSQLAKSAIGKQPSMINRDGRIHGIKEWSRRPALTSDASIRQWMTVQDYGFCIRTGHDGLIAIDADVNDWEDAERLYSSLCSIAQVDSISRRRRGGEGASRWAALVQIVDDNGAPLPAPLRKLVLGAPRAAHPPVRETPQQRAARELKETGKVEILTAGQQLVCAGMHSASGTRYVWDGGIKPTRITRAQLERWLAYIRDVDGFGTGADAPEWPKDEATLHASIGTSRQAGVLTPDIIGDNRLARWLVDTGKVIGVTSRGLQVRCPWEHLHTTDTGPGATLFIPAGVGGQAHDGFQCLHGHCEHRTILDAKAEWAKEGYEDVDFPEGPAETGLLVTNAETGEVALNPDMDPVLLVDTDLDDAAAKVRAESDLRKEGEPWYREKDGSYILDQRGLNVALRHNIITGLTFVLDTFTQQIIARPRGQNAWRPIRDTDYTRARMGLERHNCRRFTKEMVRDGIELLAEEQKRDLAAQWLRTNIPQWDGVKRVETFWPVYCGTRDNDYTRAAGRYTFSALWGRANAAVDPVKADIVPVLVGAQGVGKSELVRRIVPVSDWAGVIDFSHKQDDIARSIQGRVAVEAAELAGMDRKSLNEIKMFITLPYDSWIPKYHENPIRVNRRCLIFMTTNEREIFPDTTGNRRYAPLEIIRVNIPMLRRDILQLWAEAREMYNRDGVMWQELEELAREVTPEYMSVDSWTEAIAAWIGDAGNAGTRLSPETLMVKALGLHPGQMDAKSTRRVCAILRGLGYERKRVRVDGGDRREYRWTLRKDQ